MINEKNPFEAICERAVAEKWCWNMGCTTCGHMHFRYAFKELVAGVSPGSKEWVTSARTSRLHTLLGEMPRRFTFDQQRALASILAKSSVKKIATASCFPDWLGYMGLGLSYTEDAESNDRTLTSAWIPQLLEMLPNSSRAASMLASTLESKSSRLQWMSLEVVEGALQGRGQHSGV